MLRFLFLVLISYATACPNPHTTALNGFKLPYRLHQPDQTFLMPPDLLEISGLGLAPDGKTLVAVQDEEGIVFFLNRKTGSIIRQIAFWKDGDYEGIEMVGKDIFVVKSSGTIYHILYYDNRYDQVEKYSFSLSRENDVEGLAYDAKNNRLLLACKAKAESTDTSDTQRGIYSFDLNTMQLSTQPVFTISLEDVQQYLTTVGTTVEKLEQQFAEDAEKFAFAPSGIAIHPRTGHIYIISSVGKTLFVLHEQGKILHIEKLQKKIHTQPEGICFAQDGTLYISNEGKKGEPGKIYVFHMQ